MAITGKLQEMSLPTLIQMICTEQRKAALVVRHERLEEGVLFFEGGEIVHARVGSLVGADAVYQLLQWQNGAFHLGDQVRIPRRTVNQPWRYLVLEGMKKLDEENVGAARLQQNAPLTPQQIAADEELEMAVINLLSQFDHARSQISARRNRKRPSFVLQTLSDMVNKLADYSQRDLPPGSITLEQALTLTSDNYPAVRLLQHQNNQLFIDVISNLYNNWSGDAASRRQIFTGLCQGLVDIQQSFFAHVIGAFHSLSLADQWRETCRAFWEELTEDLRKVKF
jgi:hypothetical protein